MQKEMPRRRCQEGEDATATFSNQLSRIGSACNLTNLWLCLCSSLQLSHVEGATATATAIAGK